MDDRPAASVASEQPVASPIKGTYVAVGFPLAAIALALLTHASGLSISWPLFLCFIVAAALGERVTVQVTPRHRLSIAFQVVIVAALLGGPLAGGIVGLATQLASGDTIWRRRSTDAGLSALQGLCVGLLAPLPAHDARIQIVLVAAACCISCALNVVAQALIGLEREVRPWLAHVRHVAKTDAAGAVASFPFVLLLTSAQETTVIVAGLASVLAFYALLRHLYLRHRQALSVEQSLARHDAITGAPNLLALDEELALAHRRVLRGERPAGLYVLDLDHFKRVNDEHGHSVGSTLLRQVASRLSESLRRNDFLARYGGEEFVVLAAGIDASDLPQFAERLRLAVASKPFVIDDKIINVTVSVGGALLDGTRVPDEVFNAADGTLAQAKKKRNSSVVERREGSRVVALVASLKSA
jgi:diguanylate cyclase (GGDEF)-like protein